MMKEELTDLLIEKQDNNNTGTADHWGKGEHIWAKKFRELLGDGPWGGTASLKVATHCQTITPAFHSGQGCPPLTYL